FPDTFEIIISANHKRLICAAFPDVAPGERDEDRKLLAIRKTLPAEPKTIWTFYRDGLKERWEPKKKKEAGPPPSPSPEPQPVKPSQTTAGVVAPQPTIESIA